MKRAYVAMSMGVDEDDDDSDDGDSRLPSGASGAELFVSEDEDEDEEEWGHAVGELELQRQITTAAEEETKTGQSGAFDGGMDDLVGAFSERLKERDNSMGTSTADAEPYKSSQEENAVQTQTSSRNSSLNRRRLFFKTDNKVRGAAVLNGSSMSAVHDSGLQDDTHLVRTNSLGNAAARRSTDLHQGYAAEEQSVIGEAAERPQVESTRVIVNTSTPRQRQKRAAMKSDGNAAAADEFGPLRANSAPAYERLFQGAIWMTLGASVKVEGGEGDQNQHNDDNSLDVGALDDDGAALLQSASQLATKEAEVSDNSSYHESDVVLEGGLRVPRPLWNALLPFQREGLEWLWGLNRQGQGGILGDEMGLGKTVQMCALLTCLRYSGRAGPVLIVCPATLTHQWAKEIARWCPILPYIIFDSSVVTKDIIKLARRCKKGDGVVVIMTYEGVRRRQSDVHCLPWEYLVLDEGHRIRNPNAGVTVAIKGIRSAHRLILSGSPIQNSLEELWSLFDFVFPGKLGTLPVFQQQFSEPIKIGGMTSATRGQIALAFECAISLRDMIKPFLLRRLKKAVNLSLPGKREEVIFCKLTREQRALYQSVIQSNRAKRVLSGEMQVFGILQELGQICNHPHLYNDHVKELERNRNKRRPYSQDDSSSDEEFPDVKRHSTLWGDVNLSGKMRVLNKILEGWRENGDRVLLFSQRIKMLSMFETYCSRKGWPYLRMDGTASTSQRAKLVSEFNNNEGVFIFLLSTKVGGVGLNLTAANRVILYDPDWNPATDAQARERSWRIGQERDVIVYRFLTKGTIEEKIYQRQVLKQFIAQKIFQEGGNNKRRFKKSTLRSLLELDEQDEEISDMMQDAKSEDHLPEQEENNEDSSRIKKMMEKFIDEDVQTIDHEKVMGGQENSKKGRVTHEDIIFAKQRARRAVETVLQDSRRVIDPTIGRASGPAPVTWTGEQGTAGSSAARANASSVTTAARRPPANIFGGQASQSLLARLMRQSEPGQADSASNVPSSGGSFVGQRQRVNKDEEWVSNMLVQLKSWLRLNGGEPHERGATFESVVNAFQSRIKNEAQKQMFLQILREIATTSNKRWKLKRDGPVVLDNRSGARVTE